MPWMIVDTRSRQPVAAARLGAVEFTTEAHRALKFHSSGSARDWISKNTVSNFGDLALMKDAVEPEHPRLGRPGHYRARTYR